MFINLFLFLKMYFNIKHFNCHIAIINFGTKILKNQFKKILIFGRKYELLNKLSRSIKLIYIKNGNYANNSMYIFRDDIENVRMGKQTKLRLITNLQKVIN